MRKGKDPERLDAYTGADWSRDPVNRKSTSAGVLKIRSATVREFTKGQSCQTLLNGESVYCAVVTTTAEVLHLQRLLEFLKMRSRFDWDSNQRQHAASSNDRGAVFSSTLKQDSCGFKRNTKKES